METLRIIEKKNKITWDYDAEADVLYISFGNPKKVEGIDIGEGTIIRINKETNEINGLTILNPILRTLEIIKNQSKTISNKD
jgi:uncharacterized protein YuzE